MSTEARKCWREIVPQLVKLRVVAEIDRNALARYCVLWVRWRRLSQDLAEQGETYPLTDKSGETRCWQQRPEVAIVKGLSTLLLRLEQEFGLTPAARPNIHVPPAPEQADPMHALIERLQKRRQSEN